MTSVNIQDAFPKGQPSQRLNKESIGAWFKFDANATNVSDLYVRPVGQLLSRSEYPEFWEWVQNSRDDLLDDTSWLAVKAASPNGAVSNYSNGDGSTTFRIPSTGNTEDGSGVFFRDKGSITDPVLLNVGQQDNTPEHGHVTNMLNVSGPAGTTANIGNNNAEFWGTTTIGVYSHAFQSVAVTPRTGSSSEDLANTSDFMVSKDGSQTQPNNMLMSYYIYTGKGTASYSPLPDVYDELEALKQENAEMQTELDRVSRFILDRLQ